MNEPPRLTLHAERQHQGAEDLCADGCGLSAHDCQSLHDQLVALVLARLKMATQRIEHPSPWPKAA